MSILFVALQAALIFSSPDDISSAMKLASTKIGGEVINSEMQPVQNDGNSYLEVLAPVVETGELVESDGGKKKDDGDDEKEEKDEDDEDDDNPDEEEAEPASNYYLHKDIVTTYFWVGEGASEDNGGISNVPSAWDEDWVKHFGGEDDPKKRDGYFPSKFTPKENPFYFALPYNDFDDDGERRSDAKKVIPWAGGKDWKSSQSMCKNQWIKIIKKGKAAYAQWEDVGPFEENDSSYVFGSSKPKNKDHSKAGLDVSPAVRDYLDLDDVDKADWQFIDASSVPDGPWKKIVTTSQVNWH